MKNYIRKPLFNALWKALHSRPNFIQVISGPRQVGKTTLALQVMERWEGPKVYESADRPNIPSRDWISAHWRKARELSQPKGSEVLLVLDETQKIPHWSEAVKKLFDEDRRFKNRLRVVLLGSSALLMQRGVIIRAETDTNGDGKRDEWVTFKDGKPTKAEKDTNADGKADTFLTYDSEGKITKSETDANRDGKIDEWVSYKDGKPIKAEKDTDGDGVADTWLTY